MDLRKLETWIYGAIGAAINVAATAGALVISDPKDFNLFGGGLTKLATVTLTLAISGFYLYITQHPIPLGANDGTSTPAPQAPPK